MIVKSLLQLVLRFSDRSNQDVLLSSTLLSNQVMVSDLKKKQNKMKTAMVPNYGDVTMGLHLVRLPDLFINGFVCSQL